MIYNNDKINIIGNGPLYGKTKVNGAKNASLPIMVSSLLATKQVIIKDIPLIRDIEIMSELLESLGCRVENNLPNNIFIDPTKLQKTEASYSLVSKVRASFLVIGPLLAKQGYAKVPMPGGCDIGNRPIDFHLKGLEALGAEINTGYGFVEVKCNRLTGNRIYLDFPSVGATENIMMAATLAEGTTIIENAAEEPEIADLANFLNLMGAKITGAGTHTIKIHGVEKLSATEGYMVIPDRIEAGTLMTAVAATGGRVLIENIIFDHIRPVKRKLQEMGIKIKEENGGILIESNREKLKPVEIKTLPAPGFPTDMQPQITALLASINGESIVTETIFEDRFKHVDELKRMEADIFVKGNTACIKGKSRLIGAPVQATDLRAGASLIIAGLVAEGTTEISDVHHIDRGYYKLVDKLNELGAYIWRGEDKLQVIEGGGFSG